MPVEIRPIGPDDLGQVSTFLTEHLNPRVPPAAWSAAVRPTVGPDHGVLARDGGRLVGAYLAIYSERTVPSEPSVPSERGVGSAAGQRQVAMCNLAAWCVLADYRLHSLKMVRALLNRDGYHFTDFSPSGSVVALNRRLGFVDLDTAAVMVPNLVWPTLPGRVRIVADPVLAEGLLTGPALEAFRDHRHRAAARQLVVVRGDAACLVVFRRDRRKGLPLFASVLHVSDRDVFRAGLRSFGRHLLLRHRIPVTLLEHRVVGPVGLPGVAVSRPRPKMYRSPDLDPTQIDYLNSELTHVAW